MIHDAPDPYREAARRRWEHAENHVDESIASERERAHLKHGDTSMRHSDPLAERRFRILVEEVGEIAEAYNDNDHGKFPSHQAFVAHVFDELIQVAAMASDWAIAIGAMPIRNVTNPQVPDA